VISWLTSMCVFTNGQDENPQVISLKN